MASDARIGVTVLTGFLGSGKTTLLNRMVRAPRFAQSAVVINEFGSIGIDHHLVRHVGDSVRVLEGGCICCMVRGGLADTLRDLFLLAVRRAIQPFRHVLIETSGLASPAPILFTLRHEHFLAERYVYNGTIAVADAPLIATQIEQEPEAAQQIALADEVAISKTDLATDAQLRAARDAIHQVNPTARMHILAPEAPVPEGLLAERLYRGRSGAAPEDSPWLGRYTRRRGGKPGAAATAGQADPYAVNGRADALAMDGQANAFAKDGQANVSAAGSPAEMSVTPSSVGAAGTGVPASTPPGMRARFPHEVAVATLILSPPISRAAFLRGMAALQAELGASLLRVKGLVCFVGERAPSAVHGVHDQLYPMVPLAQWPDGEEESRLVFIARGLNANALDKRVRWHLGQGQVGGTELS